jgi:PPOX class probable F420-dependent enzyme
MLDDKTIALAQGKNFAAISTIMPSGQPQSQVTWVDTDGEHVIFNTEIHRAKFKNLERDPKVTVLIIDATNPWSYSEVRGHVAEIVRGQEARDHIDTLAKKYMGVDDYPNPIQSERVIVKIAPDRIITFPPVAVG